MICLVALDVDGVLTDGRLTYGEILREPRTTWPIESDNDQPQMVRLVSFYSRDGHGLAMLKAAGIKTAWLSGNSSAAVAKRADKLGIDYVRLGLPMDDKPVALQHLLDGSGIALGETAFMGDDLPDVSCIRMVGLGAAPVDAAPEAIAAATWVSVSPGGHGAVRELCDYVLRLRAFGLEPPDD